MTVDQFKQWLDGFVDALQLEVGGIDLSDMEDIFNKIKEKLAEKMQGMTLEQQKEFMKMVREGKVKIS